MGKGVIREQEGVLVGEKKKDDWSNLKIGNRGQKYQS